MITFGMASIEEIQSINQYAEKGAGKSYPFSALYMVCRKAGELAGYCVIRVQEGFAELIDAVLFEEDEQLIIVLIKAALNAVDLAGTQDVVCKNPALEGLLLKLKFQKKEPMLYTLNLDGYFTPCSCK